MRNRRENRKEERATFGRRGTATRYQMREKLVAFGDDYFIHNEAGQKVFKVDGKVLRVRDTLKFKDLQGNVLCQIQERMLRIKDVMAIEDAKGNKIAEVKKALITPLRDRWTVKLRNGPDLDVQGNILDHEYEIKEARRKGADVIITMDDDRRELRNADVLLREGVIAEIGQNLAADGADV